MAKLTEGIVALELTSNEYQALRDYLINGYTNDDDALTRVQEAMGIA
jgi:hypothetical protein